MLAIAALTLKKAITLFVLAGPVGGSLAGRPGGVQLCHGTSA